MATPRLGRALTCPNCFGRLPFGQQSTTARSLLLPSPLQQSLTQVRHARTLTKAELEDLQGIPVRLLKNIIGFGKQNAIIRVKPGRMRNQWHHKGLAEYMTKKRFQELGLTEAAIGVRDRSFGTQIAGDENTAANNAKKATVEDALKAKRKDPIVMTPDETRALLDDLLPRTLFFVRKPIAPTTTPAAQPLEPATPRSPSLAANAQVSTSQEEAAASAPSTSAAAEQQQDSQAIFGSVAAIDIVTLIRETLLAEGNGSRVALEAEAIAIQGLEAGEDRIKRLGVYEVEIITGKGLEPVRRTIEVVSDVE